ncbi:hypothetical protein AA309_10110 [Microvirga vignae]|uniref:Uncharacterized protein n=1 Tax=Microvirga vignae TaxID=1225564 RepID=A0A0H1RKJ6_9HYPH|nr:hypothetical protein [Microvirga vignae]KLK93147.1 hypothetical protein AA309_10110 [Microvirga vignae]
MLLSTPLRRGILTFLALSIVLYPVFITLLRVVLFNTIITDDYAPYLLYLIGHPEGSVPGAPWAYRVLSVAAAIPFRLLPVITFSNLPGDWSPAYIAAKQALAVLSYLCMVATVCVAGYAAATRFGCGPLGTFLAGALAFILAQYIALYSLDAPALLLISFGVLALNSLPAFSALMVVSALANEKVLIVFGLMFAVRLLLRPARQRAFLFLFPVIAGCALYGAAMMAFPLPLMEHQQNLGHLLPSIMMNVQASLTLRGLLLNVLPVLVVFALALLARTTTLSKHAPYASQVDWLVVPLLLCVAMVASVTLNVGRIVMHAFPLFIGPVALALEQRIQNQSAHSFPGRAT